MAKKQTRRSVTLSRLNYDAAQRAAASRGMSIAGLVEHALGTSGVPVVMHPQQAPLSVRALALSQGSREPTQPRRSVSINRSNYEAAKQAAARRGMSLAGLVEHALDAIGVPVVVRQPPAAELARSPAVEALVGIPAARGEARQMLPQDDSRGLGR